MHGTGLLHCPTSPGENGGVDHRWYLLALTDTPVVDATVFGLFRGWARYNHQVLLALGVEGGWLYLGRAIMGEGYDYARAVHDVLGLGPPDQPMTWTVPEALSEQQQAFIDGLLPSGLFEAGLGTSLSRGASVLPTFQGWVHTHSGTIYRLFRNEGSTRALLLPHVHEHAPVLLTPDVVLDVSQRKLSRGKGQGVFITLRSGPTVVLQSSPVADGLLDAGEAHAG